MAGKPVSVIFIFALRPGLKGLAWIMAIRSDKMKAEFRLRDPVMDGHFYGGASGNWLRLIWQVAVFLSEMATSWGSPISRKAW